MAQTQSPAVATTQLVQQTLAHEFAAATTASQYMYRLHAVTPQSSETRIVVETRDFLISRLVLKNGEPLSRTQQQQENERLRSLLAKRVQLMKQLQTEKHAADARVQRVIAALPDAFRYQYAGAQKDSRGRELVVVRFQPNPRFHPRTAELKMLKGVEGTMLIDAVAARVVRIQATLCRDIDVGWGLFAHVARGGSFLLEQQVVWQTQWAITTLAIHCTNRRILLLTSHVDSLTSASDFRRLPADLTLEQGLKLLLEQDPMTTPLSRSENTP